MSTKLDQMRLDGEPHNPFGVAMAAAVIDARDKFAECHGIFPAIAFHGLKCKLKNLADAMGCSPHLRLLHPAITNGLCEFLCLERLGEKDDAFFQCKILPALRC